MITVVAGILTVPSDEGTRLLLTQWKPDQPNGYAWGCPGGKAEPEETHHRTLKRELQEELHIIIGKISEKPVAHVPMNDLGFDIFFYMVGAWGGVIRLVDPMGIGYFTKSETSGLRLKPGNLRAEVEIANAAFGRWP